MDRCSRSGHDLRTMIAFRLHLLCTHWVNAVRISRNSFCFDIDSDWWRLNEFELKIRRKTRWERERLLWQSRIFVIRLYLVVGNYTRLPAWTFHGQQVKINCASLFVLKRVLVINGLTTNDCGNHSAQLAMVCIRIWLLFLTNSKSILYV